MNELEHSYRRTVRELEGTGCAAALVGGIAASIRAKVRFTRNVDLAVEVAGDLEAEVLVRQMIGAGYGVVAMIEQEETGRFATARLVTPGGDQELAPIVNLLFASSGIEPEIVAEATELEVWPGTRGRVARVGHLIALKLLSRSERRMQDQVDLVELIKVADEGELGLAFAAAALIEARGFARGRRLGEDLRELLVVLRR